MFVCVWHSSVPETWRFHEIPLTYNIFLAGICWNDEAVDPDVFPSCSIKHIFFTRDHHKILGKHLLYPPSRCGVKNLGCPWPPSHLAESTRRRSAMPATAWIRCQTQVISLQKRPYGAYLVMFHMVLHDLNKNTTIWFMMINGNVPQSFI